MWVSNLFSKFISHVRYINNLTWRRGFQDKLLYLEVLSLFPSLLWELRDERNLTFWPQSLESMLEYKTWPLVNILDNLWDNKPSLNNNVGNNLSIKWGGGGGNGQGGQNLPPPVPCSPASRTFISYLPSFTVLFPSRDLRSPACLTFWQFDSLCATHMHSCHLTFYDLYDVTTVNGFINSPEVSLFFSPSANFRLLARSEVSIVNEKTS